MVLLQCSVAKRRISTKVTAASHLGEMFLDVYGTVIKKMMSTFFDQQNGKYTYLQIKIYQGSHRSLKSWKMKKWCRSLKMYKKFLKIDFSLAKRFSLAFIMRCYSWFLLYNSNKQTPSLCIIMLPFINIYFRISKAKVWHFP